ncbi:MAG: Rv3235 family protein [Streptosporangiales bacterium]
MPATASLHRVPIPRSEPPYDDELDQAPAPPAGRTSVPWVQGALAIAVPLDTPEAWPRPARAPLHVVESVDDDARTPRAEPEDDAEPEPCGQVPPIHRPWLGRLAQALVEVLSGERAPRQLLAWTSDEVYAAITARAAALAGDRSGSLTRRPPLQLRTVHVSQPATGVAEVCALVHRGGRARALALRVEAWRGRWRCTAFELA